MIGIFGEYWKEKLKTALLLDWMEDGRNICNARPPVGTLFSCWLIEMLLLGDQRERLP